MTGFSESNSSKSTSSNMKPPFFDDWAHIALVILFVLLVFIFAAIVFKYCKKNISRCMRSVPHYTIEVRPVSLNPLHGQNDVPNSPVFCEDDAVASQFSSTERIVNERTGIERNLAGAPDFYLENVDDDYEDMNPLQTSKEYAYAYGHVNVNAGYMNTSSQWGSAIGVEDDYYEYPQNRRNSAPEYHYAYDWLDPSAGVAGLSASQPVLTDTDVEGNSEDEYCYPENVDDHYETVNPSQASEEYNYAYDHANINSGFMNIFEDDPDVDGNSDDSYCYPDLTDDKYEIMHPVDPLEASGEYARTYDHTSINIGYMNCENGYEVPHDYVMARNSGQHGDLTYAKYFLI